MLVLRSWNLVWSFYFGAFLWLLGLFQFSFSILIAEGDMIKNYVDKAYS